MFLLNIVILYLIDPFHAQHGKDELRKVIEPQELQGKVHDDRLGKLHESFKIPSTMKVSGGVLYEPQPKQSAY